MNDTNKQELINKLTESAYTLSKNWSQKDAGDLTKWFELIESVISIVEQNYKLSDVDKIEFATQAVLNIAKGLWEKHTNSLSQDELNAIRNGDLKILHLILDNPQLLNASASVVSKLLKKLDTNGDGKITKDECRAFWCCGCN